MTGTILQAINRLEEGGLLPATKDAPVHRVFILELANVFFLSCTDADVIDL